MPWKNGGGETWEIATSPCGASLDDFDWRVSMARVQAAGPFSQFPGVDRTLAVLEGGGLALRFATEDRVALTAAAEPFSFPADIPVDAELPAGGITDLNVMTRRSFGHHRLRRLALAEPALLTSGTDDILLLAWNADVLVRDRDVEFTVAAGDTLHADNPAGRSFALYPRGDAILFAVEFWRS